jgi:hypothetical protein
MLLSGKVVLLQKKCDECWLMGYRVRYPAETSSHSFTASRRMRHESACFCHVTMHPFKYTSVRLSPIRISMLTFNAGKVSIAKTVHDVHVCILCVSKSSRIFCCYRSCYRQCCPRVINVCISTNSLLEGPFKHP